ncbi:1,3-beta-galactosyl-N-acetylhexosamine phosphorylase [Schleiferilactobacillus shenzhenensis]|nr:1,3-beta-galactosyl-N-acetylhexosamine phosphorylase [Schleiferilactobacillus shenzhenensis]
MMTKETGRLTIPSDTDFLKETQELITRWGADAIRDSDGTKLDTGLKQLAVKLYSTYFVARGYNDFAEKHPETVQSLYLMSDRITATGTTVTIPFMAHYFDQQIRPNYRDDPHEYWEVIDRTADAVVPTTNWSLLPDDDTVTIRQAAPYHEYTVSFLAELIWDPTEMYNHLTNHWGDVPHQIPFDVRYPEAQQFIRDTLRRWLAANPEIDVVRFTTFFYHFTLIFDDQEREKFVDWLGYGGTVSVPALKAFEKVKGYRLRPEDFVDDGFYNSSYRVPSRHYRDYVDFIARFVADQAKILVDEVHAAGKEAMMFLGDNWIGTEPYGPYFKDIGLDAVVGSVGNATTLRLISDIPHVKYTEGRFLPYFFPDVFHKGGDPVAEAKQNWLTARRAIMRKPVDRIGYGGYLKLAAQFPDFVDYVTHVADEFRDIYSKIHGVKPYAGLTVGVLNAWGKLRTWQPFIVAHGKRYKQAYSYEGVMEALAGQAVNVRFLSFADITSQGVPKDIDVLINVGAAGTAFSGGDAWQDPALVTTIRAWVAAGHGFVGIGEPSAIPGTWAGRTFQLADVLGVDQEAGFSLSTDKYQPAPVADHFLTDGLTLPLDYGESTHNVYAFPETAVIAAANDEVTLTSHDYGQGRGVYLAGLPFSPQNANLLLRLMFWAAKKENAFQTWYATNPETEVAAYPDAGLYAVLNNTSAPQTTTVYTTGGQQVSVSLAPEEIRWERIDHEY